MTREQQLMIAGMDMLLRKFSKFDNQKTFTVEEIIEASNSVYDAILNMSNGEQIVKNALVPNGLAMTDRAMEFENACRKLGGTEVKLNPGTASSINIFGI